LQSSRLQSHSSANLSIPSQLSVTGSHPYERCSVGSVKQNSHFRCGCCMNGLKGVMGCRICLKTSWLNNNRHSSLCNSVVRRHYGCFNRNVSWLGVNSLLHGVNSLWHEVNSLRHGVKSLWKGVNSLWHGVNLLWHKVLSLSHGIHSLRHRVNWLWHGNFLLWNRVTQCDMD